MFVHFLHAICFLAYAAIAQSAESRMLLWVTVDRQWSPGLVRAFRAEVAHMAVSGFSGIDFHYDEKQIAATTEFVVSVRITGTCNANYGRPATPAPLGYVILTNGTISPDIFVSCDAILQAIEPLIASRPPIWQNKLLARAIVRVTRHELRHILDQTADHLANGIFKAHLQPAELISQ